MSGAIIRGCRRAPFSLYRSLLRRFALAERPTDPYAEVTADRLERELRQSRPRRS
jgi:hypothetical protein